MNASFSITPKGEKLANTQLENQWINFDWKKAEIFVNRLQSRIAKAVIQSKWSLAKRMQYLLIHSYYAKLLATNDNTGLIFPVFSGLKIPS